MCEGVGEEVGEDSRHGGRHVIVHALHVCGCVNMALHVHLGGE